MYDENIYAEVVFDGDETHAPARMGTPKDDQLQGTTLERLVELAGRVCYDSLGKGRSSAAYHKHIAEVGHGSVWEHANFTICLHLNYDCDVVDEGDFLRSSDFVVALANRPGVWIENYLPEIDEVYITSNLRAVVEWDDWTPQIGVDARIEKWLPWILRKEAHILAPQIVDAPENLDVGPQANLYWENVIPVSQEQAWVSLLLGGSRGMSHEQVRHKFRTAVSQRSTRYVDESDSPWVEHPLTTRYNDDVERLRTDSSEDPRPRKVGFYGSEEPHAAEGYARWVYRDAAYKLQAACEAQGIDKHTARKQARGAARGYLGNALHTELIFSASVAQWKRMIAMRCSPYADAEIRVLYGYVLRALKTTKWVEDFAEFNLVPSTDGIGEVVAGC